MKNAGFCEMRIGLGCLIVLLFIAGGAAAANPTETAVLNSFLKGLSNGDVLGWTGDDPCTWKHISCRGQSVTRIGIEAAGLVGTVPPDLNKLTNLEWLGFQGNHLSGSLPSLNGLKYLQTAYFNDNNFTTIPWDFFRGLDSLEFIYLDYNLLNGTTGWTLPSDVQSCSKLQNLSLTKTGLTGSIPDFLGKMPSLRVLNLAYNLLTGGLPEGFRDSGLTQLEVNNMKLEGPIDVVGSMTSLRQLWLQVNQFTGTIPSGLANATGLSDLRLNDNKLKGLVPSELATLPSITNFSVRNNNLMGSIPAVKGTVIVSDGNKFCQSEPGKDCGPELQALLGFLSGVGFPDTLVSSWSGTDPCNMLGASCTSGSVVSLNLPNSQLVGTISPAIGGLTKLEFLTLRNNNLTGPIPSVLGTMKSLQQVDLRNNNLTGPLIKFSDNVKVLLDGNPLLNGSPPPTVPSPTFPVVGQPPAVPDAPQTPPPTSTKPAPSPTTPSIPPTKSPAPPTAASPTGPPPGTIAGPNRSPSKVSAAAVAIPVAAGVSLAVLAGLAIFLFCCRQKGKKVTASRSSSSGMLVHPRNSNSDPDMVKVSVTNGVGGASGPSNGDVHVVEAGNLVISIQVLLHATKNFSQDTILGRGGFGVVYKGVLDDGTSIAVKRMESSTVVSSKGLSEFHAEIAVLTKVRHRHLVALLGYCIEGNEKLLVYEYLPNGTLGQHLFEHRALGFKPLDWKKRLVIALDVARGMEYLHTLAYMSFIHRDLKPSNILLDDEFRAKVSDFGLVKLAPEGKYSIETRLAGTFGYLAPEYAVTGRVTTKADVFSFGVVLMELITGRKALDETQSEENMHLVTWFRRTNQRRETFPQMIDPTLEATEDKVEESIYTVAELAKHCTAREPYNRPDMGHAVSVLAPLVEQWKPSDVDGEETKGIDLNVSLPQALKQWQASDDVSSLDDSQASLPTRPVGFADSFTSSDAR